MGGSCRTLVCLDRKQSPLTFDPGPLCRCEPRPRVYLPAFASRAGSFSRRFPRNRWSSFLVWAACAGAQVSCPEVHRGSDGVAVFITRSANGQRRTDTPQEGRLEGREEWRGRQRGERATLCAAKTSAHTFVTPQKNSLLQEEEEEAVMSRRQLLLLKSC